MKSSVVIVGGVMLTPKLQALVYDILHSTIVVFSYATGPRKLSANEQFFVQYNTILLSLCREISFLARHLHKNIQYS